MEVMLTTLFRFAVECRRPQSMVIVVVCCLVSASDWVVAIGVIAGQTNHVCADELFRVATRGDALIVPVSVGGRERMALVDTGCGITIFDPGLVKNLGAPVRSIQSFDGSEFHKSELFKAPEFQIGRLNAKLDEVEFQDLQSVRSAIGYQFSGVIGMDFLRQYALSIDFDRGELRVHDTPLDEELVKGFRKPCVLRHEPNVVIVFNRLPGNVIDDTEPFWIDTGLSVSLGLKEEVFDALVTSGAIQNLSRQSSISITKTREYTTGDLRGFEFAGVKHSSLRCVRLKVNLIGQALLSRYQVTMDFPHKEMWFRPGKRIGEVDPTDLLGIGVTLDDDGGVVVGELDRDSVAEKSGILLGDEFLEIDGRPVNEFTLFRIQWRFTEAGECRLKIRRNGKVREYQLQLAPLKSVR